MRLSALDAAEMVGGELHRGARDTAIRGVSIDSRTISPGELFFAIVGPRHDGHDHAAAALERGAVGIVCDRPVDVVSARPVDVRSGGVSIVVSDTTRALQDLAHGVRVRSDVRVVAITGSMGKTTTKDAAAAAISSRHRVLKSPGNLNNLYGLPLSLLALDGEDVAVVEMGMSEPGEIRRLTEIAKPDVGVLVNVAEVHLEFFPSLEAIASAKGELFEELDETAVAVVNADDPLVLAQARKFSGRHLRYGMDADAELRAHRVRTSEAGLRFDVDEGADRTEVVSKLHGRHNVYNLLAGLAAARALDVPLEDAAKALASLTPPSHRGERVSLAGGVVVVDETYNSNPRAVKCALDALGVEAGTRRVAVLGDMLELGADASSFHEDVGRYAASIGVELLIGVGVFGDSLVAGAHAAGLPLHRVHHCADAREAFDVITAQMRPGDVVLVKGSRSVGLDRLVDRLVREDGEAS